MPAGGVTAGVIGASDGADHALSGGLAPKGTHAFTGVAAPALDEGTGSEVGAIDLSEFGFVKPSLGAAVNLVAVIEHEAGAVGVAEVFEIGDLDAVARLSRIEVVDELLLGVEENQVNLELLLHALNLRDEVLLFLPFAPADIAGLVDQPGDESVVAVCLAQLLKADAGGMDEICPPVIVGNPLELLPFDERRAAGDDNIFRLISLLGAEGDAPQSQQEKKAGDRSIHDE